MNEPRCYQCGYLLPDINAACPQCLPNFYNRGQPKPVSPDDLRAEIHRLKTERDYLRRAIDLFEKSDHLLTLDGERLDWLDRFIHGDDSVSFCEEDGGVICSVNTHRVQQNHVGKNIREAIDSARSESKIEIDV